LFYISFHLIISFGFRHWIGHGYTGIFRPPCKQRLCKLKLFFCPNEWTRMF
jgi:hypothetical protein